MKAREMFRHQIRWAVIAHAIGMGVLLLALWLRSLSLAMAGAVFVLSVGLGAKATMRCPFCQRPVAGEMIRWPLLWQSRVPARCPFCATDYEQDM